MFESDEPVAIEVDGLAREFRVMQRAPGLRSSLRSLVRRRYDTIRAVDDVTFRTRAPCRAF
jgi:ABC-type uncharacterized transport system ATPase subunit